MQSIETRQKQEVYSVSRLNQEAKLILENHFPLLAVEGEISNFSAPHSGHWYFTLKDAKAQVRCAMFRGHNSKLTFLPKDGMHVLIMAEVSLYENRGEFQLIVTDMQEQGEGKLRRAFELLAKKLQAAGLFDPAHKKSLPSLPKQIGVITSPTGAAIRDILIVLKRRFPSIPVVIYPTLVQGETAATYIVSAIQTANRRQECDVLILARGGGSLEDLWPFNEEIVAQAIFASQIPLISGIGHEVDFTIADFVADARAATPSAAAELVAPDQSAWSQRLSREQQRLAHCLRQKLATLKQHIGWAHKHLFQQHPKRRLSEQMQRLDFCELTLVQLQQRKINKLQQQLQTLKINLQKHLPLLKISDTLRQVHAYQQQLCNNINHTLHDKQKILAHAAAKLDGLSPLATLERGYAIATRAEDQHILRQANEVKPGDKIRVRLQQGSLDCEVELIDPLSSTTWRRG